MIETEMRRNFYCYSCTNATEKCYRKEIGCPCGKYKSYKDENVELKEKLDKIRNYLANDIPHELMNEATNKIWRMV